MRTFGSSEKPQIAQMGADRLIEPQSHREEKDHRSDLMSRLEACSTTLGCDDLWSRHPACSSDTTRIGDRRHGVRASVGGAANLCFRDSVGAMTWTGDGQPASSSEQQVPSRMNAG